ncbi:MAG TPA: glucuronate isomerase [Candidatus Alectryocaccomicrobium excrementavium]|uniref:Uronate isomerase n=1 Tax=Candidatus Alectryocaccomicrobium excrementavium TaxID=2840668 RepID=A0A9D1G3A3_9FIRM|nr:glucuronate isomerase [Candidatus Alectryocaccomicrobium excrementavium]
MKPFMDKNFLLKNETARRLYAVAETMPIIDYHCHLSPQEIAENIPFRNIGHLMLGGDHYKWRLMRAFGIDEKFICGDASDYDKFLAYARMLPYAIGNPLYHWTHLELRRVFGIEDVLNEASAPSIWERANALLATEEYRAKGLIRRFNVEVICTTDDPIDSLESHRAIARDGAFATRVLPAFRPDRAINAARAGFREYMQKLSEVSGVDIRTTDDVVEALSRRIEYFHACGARISDHGLDSVPHACFDRSKADRALAAGLMGHAVRAGDLDAYRTLVLVALGNVYHKMGWAQQYHLGALRSNNRRMFERLGPDTGFDSVADAPFAHDLSRILDAQDATASLPKTVLYCLNGTANPVIATMAGNFQGDGIRGKIQFGSGWWFCDTLPGMVDQMTSLASLGLLSQFVGMLTDSRSFVSYPRHEYFRRILCNLIGEWVENGEYPADMEALETMVKDICYYNAKRYFGL